jgi:hypothetical protein
MQLGLVSVLRQLGAEGASGDTTDVSVPASSVPLFRREGDYWTIAFDGPPVRIRDSKGMSYLARLLAAPSREVHAVDLVRGDARTSGAGQYADKEEQLNIAEGDAGPMLDAEAKSAYRLRLAELDTELREAEEWNDPERASRAQLEREMLVHELSAAVGLGGRDRSSGSPAERARISVTRAIRSAVRHIAEQDPALGAHLDATIRTGAYCAYLPGLPIRWQLDEPEPLTTRR